MMPPSSQINLLLNICLKSLTLILFLISALDADSYFLEESRSSLTKIKISADTNISIKEYM
jgi:hypothetical protein